MAKSTKRRSRSNKLTVKNATNFASETLLPGALGFAAGSYVTQLPIIKDNTNYVPLANAVIGTAVALMGKGFISNVGVGMAIRGGADLVGRYLPAARVNLLPPGARQMQSHVYQRERSLTDIKAL